MGIPTSEKACKVESVTGDGLNVRAVLCVDDGGSEARILVVMPKADARSFSSQLQAAADRPEPGCTGAEDHFHGHCGCR